MQYIEAPQVYEGHETSLFLAGGITGCPDWQSTMLAQLSDLPLVIFNPRRAHFSQEEEAAREQILWEYTYLRKASAIAFWFPQETLCPITLYEFGSWSMTTKKLFPGVHPHYQRIQDLRVQTALVRPDLSFVESLTELLQEIRSWAQTVFS
jgi:hypothetical protein